MVPSETIEQKLDFIKYQITEIENLSLENLCCILADLHDIIPESPRQDNAARNYRKLLLQRMVELIIFADIINYN